MNARIHMEDCRWFCYKHPKQPFSFIFPPAVQRPLSLLSSSQYGPGCARVQAVSFFFDIPVSIWWGLTVVLISISLTADELEHLLTWLLSIWDSFPEVPIQVFWSIFYCTGLPDSPPTCWFVKAIYIFWIWDHPIDYDRHPPSLQLACSHSGFHNNVLKHGILNFSEASFISLCFLSHVLLLLSSNDIFALFKDMKSFALLLSRSFIILLWTFQSVIGLECIF